MRIGYIISNNVSNVNYRAVGPAQALMRAGHQIEVAFARSDGGVDLQPLRQCDVVHVYRLATPQTIACVDDLQRRGIAVIWDNDDDVRLVPRDARKYVRYSERDAEREVRNQIKLLRRVDLVTTTSAYLAARWRELGAPDVVSVANHPLPEQYVKRKPRKGRVVVGWVAGLEHYADATALGIAGTLATIMERQQNVQVVTVGVRLDLQSDRYEHHREIDLSRLKDVIREFDIGIAPIADFRMSHARSDVKVKEYAAAGVPWLASARGPYAGLGPSEGGRLVDDGDWEQALESVVSSSLRRFLMRRRVTAWGQTQCVDRHVDQWVAAFERAIENAQRGRVGTKTTVIAN